MTNLKSSFLGPSFKPAEYDIICGRGRGSFARKGTVNTYYLNILRNNINRYKQAATKTEKGFLISSINRELREQGFCFLKYDQIKQRWYQLSGQQTYKRTAHAIRDLIRKADRGKEQESKYAINPNQQPLIENQYQSFDFEPAFENLANNKMTPSILVEPGRGFDSDHPNTSSFDIFFELDSRKGSLKQILDDIEEEKRKTRK